MKQSKVEGILCIVKRLKEGEKMDKEQYIKECVNHFKRISKLELNSIFKELDSKGIDWQKTDLIAFSDDCDYTLLVAQIYQEYGVMIHEPVKRKSDLGLDQILKQDSVSVPERLIKDLCFNSTHACILGRRETGKTSLGMAILEWCRKLKTKECVIYKHPKPQLLPNWIKNITDLRELTNNQVVLIDEGSSDFDQFSYAKQSNRYLAQELKKARHKNISFVFIDHSSDFLNKNMLRLIDIWLLKSNTDFNIDDEKKYIKSLYNGMGKIPEINQVWVHTDRYEGIVEVNMPIWFSDKLSKAYDNDNQDVVKIDDVINRISERNAKKSTNAKGLPKEANKKEVK